MNLNIPNNPLESNQLAQNIEQLAHLDRQGQLGHVNEHIGNFQGLQIQLAPHDHEAVENHIQQAAQHAADALATQARPNTAFHYAIRNALQHLNQVSVIIAQHHAQQQAAAPNNNAANNQVDDGNESDGSHGSDHSSLPSSISDISENSGVVGNQHGAAPNNNAANHPVEGDGENSDVASDFSGSTLSSGTTTYEGHSHASELAAVNNALNDAFALDPNDPDL